MVQDLLGKVSDTTLGASACELYASHKINLEQFNLTA